MKEGINVNISQRIFLILSEKKLKQKDLAEYIGISNSSVSDWKNKNSIPTADKIVKISEFLNVSVEYLLGIEEPTQQIMNNSGEVKKAVQAHTYNEKAEEKLDDISAELIERFKKLSFKDKAEIMIEINKRLED